MSTVAIFRLLIVTSIALAILGESVDILMPDLVPAPLNEAYEAYAASEEPSLAFALTLGVVALALAVGAIVGVIGMLLLKPWSRRLALWASVLVLAIYPFIGPVVVSSWSYMLNDVSVMCWGAALAMAYFSEIKVRFERGAADASSATEEAPA